MVLVGAEGVVRSGGLINQIGTYPLAVMARQCRKPVYCVCESYKLVDVFPLNQDDLEFFGDVKVYFQNEDDGGNLFWFHF